jgi:hypothetical protein
VFLRAELLSITGYNRAVADWPGGGVAKEIQGKQGAGSAPSRFVSDASQGEQSASQMLILTAVKDVPFFADGSSRSGSRFGPFCQSRL